jgi:predicted Zn-dependent protease
VMPQSQAYGSARAEALRALALDPALGEAHAAIAEVKLEYEWDWAGSEREFRRAITLNPGDATAHQWYADYLSRMGRHPEALREIQRALALDPLSPPVNGMLGTVAYYGRRTDDAIRQYQATLALMPDQLLTRFYLGLAYLDKKDYPEAITEFERCVRESGAIPLTRAGLGCAYGMAGKRDEALRILASLKRHAPGETVAPSWLALVCIGLGDRDQALGYIEEAYRERDSYLGHIKVAPIVDPLRSDLRFLSILRRLGLDGPPV